MAIEKEFSGEFSKKNTLRRAADRQSGTEADQKKVRDVTDKECFLREAFDRDHWEGFTLVFKHYYEPLCSHAVRFVYSRTYSEDIVSEVFTDFWQKEHFKHIRTSYRTYLFRAVRNRSMNFIRNEFGRELEPFEEGRLLSQSSSPEQQMIYEQFYHKVQNGIEQLPPKCKKVFLMSRYEGKPLKEIARIQDVSVRTVEAHISKALKMMREILNHTDQK